MLSELCNFNTSNINTSINKSINNSVNLISIFFDVLSINTHNSITQQYPKSKIT